MQLRVDRKNRQSRKLQDREQIHFVKIALRRFFNIVYVSLIYFYSNRVLTKFFVDCLVFQHYLSIDLCPINLEYWLAMTEYRFPQFIILLKYIFQRGILIRWLRLICVVCLMLRVSCHNFVILDLLTNKAIWNQYLFAKRYCILRNHSNFQLLLIQSLNRSRMFWGLMKD